MTSNGLSSAWLVRGSSSPNPFSSEYRGEGELERRGTLNRSGVTRTQETRSMRLVFPPSPPVLRRRRGRGMRRFDHCTRLARVHAKIAHDCRRTIALVQSGMSGDDSVRNPDIGNARLPNWIERVNEALSDKELEAVRRCGHRGQPFGDDGWTESITRRLNLESTMGPRGRPKKSSEKRQRQHKRDLPQT